MLMLQPHRLRRYAFNGTASAAGVVVGPSGVTGVTKVVLGMPGGSIPVQWEVKNNDPATGEDLHVRQGPSTGTFIAEAGANLGNYDILKPGEAYSYPKRHLEQEVAENTDTTLVPSAIPVQDEALLLLRGDGADVSFSGWVDCWVPLFATA